MSYLVVTDASGRVCACGPDDGEFDPIVPPGGAMTRSDVFVAVQLTAEELAEVARRQGIRDDPLRADILNRLRTATAAQISNYVDANVVDLASARALFKRILLLIALDSR